VIQGNTTRAVNHCPFFWARPANAAELLYKKARAQKKYNKVARSQVISYLADWAQKIN